MLVVMVHKVNVNARANAIMFKTSINRRFYKKVRMRKYYCSGNDVGRVS